MMAGLMWMPVWCADSLATPVSVSNLLTLFLASLIPRPRPAFHHTRLQVTKSWVGPWNEASLQLNTHTMILAAHTTSHTA